MDYDYFVVLIVLFFIAMLAVVVSVTENKHIIKLLFAFYIVGVVVNTLLDRTYSSKLQFLLNPFRKYVAIGKGIASDGMESFSKNERIITEILLNYFLFVPMGFLVPVLKENFRRLWKILLLGLVCSFCIESAQLLLHMGCFEVADLVHNSLGAGIGFGIWWKWMRE